MRILHLASFNGNIGDNASHAGLKHLLTVLLTDPFVVDRLEIRKFYKNYNLSDKRFFDIEFANFVNEYDLLIIGGGGFLDFWVEGSATGTTLDIPDTVLNRIKTPIFISSVGCIPHKPVPVGNIEKFKAFLDKLMARDNIFLAVRNDGSKQILAEHIGRQYFDNIPEVLDHGFFYENDGAYYHPCEGKYILINSTVDQLQMLNRDLGKVDERSYLLQMRLVIDYIIKQTAYKVVFAPHIYSDYQAIGSLLKDVNDYHLRTKVTVTPYSQGDYGCNQIFSAYKNSALSIGMRFHANVCSIAMGVPSIGLAALDRITRMYEGLGIYNRTVSIDDTFGETLIAKIDQCLNDGQQDDCHVFKAKKEETISLYQAAIERLGMK